MYVGGRLLDQVGQSEARDDLLDRGDGHTEDVDVLLEDRRKIVFLIDVVEKVFVGVVEGFEYLAR